MRGFGEKPGDDTTLDGGQEAVKTPEHISNAGGRAGPAKEQPVISQRVIADTVMCLDGIAILAAGLLAKWAYIVSFLQEAPQLEPYAVVAGGGAILAVMNMRFQGLYDFGVLSEIRGQSKRILLGLAVAALILVAIGYLLKISEQYSRGWFVTWFFLSAVFVFSLHLMNARILQWLSSLGAFARNIVIYGSGEIAQGLLRRIASSSLNVRVIGIFEYPQEEAKAVRRDWRHAVRWSWASR